MMKHLLASLILTGCCGPRLVEVVVPEERNEGQATSIAADPDSVAQPCDSLLIALEELRALEADTVYLHDTVRVEVVKRAKAKVEKKVQEIREQVCLWEPIHHENDRIKVSITPRPDGSPEWDITCKDITKVVECPPRGVASWWRTSSIVQFLLLALMMFLLSRPTR